MATMVRLGYWCVLPYRAVRHFPTLRISPIGVVPQRERRPRSIIDYTWSGVNDASVPLAPFPAMQYGTALKRILQQIAYADPAHGPVHMLKCDLSDGFYRIPLAPSAIPPLGVILPYSPGEAPLIAFPLMLPMGWKHSPPFFSAFTETIADLSNHALASPNNPWVTRPHRLDAIEPSTYPPLCATWPGHRRHPFNANITRAPLQWVDVYVDDFIALSQAPTAVATRRTLLHSIDSVFRPPAPGTPPDLYKDPISLSKLDKGELAWGTTKRILGWDIDSNAGTITLPAHRAERLQALLHTFISLHRTSRTKWQQLLGELRSMALAIPAAGYLFSTLQYPLSRPAGSKRIRLSPIIKATLLDWASLAAQLATHPMHISRVVPTAPTYVGACDASGSGMGGIWLPTSLTQEHPSPLVWRAPFPPSLTRALLTTDNPTGTITNSDLELLAVLAHIQHLSQHTDITHHTLLIGSDNTAAVGWCRRQSATTSGPAAYLLRHLGTLTRHAQFCPVVRSVPGTSNTIADFLSRSFHLSDDMAACRLADLFPQTSFRWLRTNNAELSKATSSASRILLPMASLHPAPPASTASGTDGAPSAPPSTWTLTSASSRIPSLPSFSLPTATATAPLLPAELLSVAERWRKPFVPWDRRWPSWGKRIPV